MTGSTDQLDARETPQPCQSEDQLCQIARSLAEVRPGNRSTREYGLTSALVVSILLHGGLVALGCVLLPAVVEPKNLIDPIMLFISGDPDAVEEKQNISPVLTQMPQPPESAEPVDTPARLEGVDAAVETLSVVHASETTAPPEAPEQSDHLISLGPLETAPPPSMFWKKPPPTIASEPVNAVSAEPVVAGGRPASVVTPARPNPARIGRRGIRNGLDNRGLPVPIYPAESRRRGEEGLVELDVEIRADGTIGQIRVIHDPGFPLLVQAAIEAVRAGQFDPATRDGRPIPEQLTIPFRFVLK